MSSPKMADLMMGCWDKDIRNSVLSEMGQGELMGFIHCTWIPFILIAINQSHLSPLSRSYSANPLVDPKTDFSTVFSLSRSRLIASLFHDNDDSAYCQPHSGSAAYTFPIVIYF